MQTTIFELLPEDLAAPECKRTLSFRPFLAYIKSVRDKTVNNKKYFFSHVIDQFEKHPEFLDPANINDLKNYAGLLELIYSSLARMVEDEEVDYWGLSVPMKPTIFYSTNAFHRLISSMSINNICNCVTSIGSINLEGKPEEFVYAVILEKYYGIPSFFNREMVHAVFDTEMQLNRYYKADLDIRFIEIYPEGKLPEIKFDMLKSGNYDKLEKLKWLHDVLPLNMFRFEGFGITSITEVSVKYAVENIKNFILKHSFSNDENYFSSVIQWLKTIVGSNEIEFGLLPALHVNNKLVFNEGLYVNSILINAAKKKGDVESNYLPLIDKYFRNPKLIFFSGISAEDEERHDYLKLLTADGIRSYALVPIYFGNSLVGVLEIYSRKKVDLDEVLLAKLDPVIPLLSQLLKNGVHEFHDGIARVIKDKFTSVQPSVQWKFNEAAWHFIRDKKIDSKSAKIEDIRFINVYPLYGAVDIRNSTIERNNALNRDMQVQFTVLIAMLERLKKQSGFSLIDEKIFMAKKWLKEIADPGVFSQQIILNDFFDNNIAPFLQDFKNGNEWAIGIMNEYFKAIDEKQGVAYEHRRQLETSMSELIGTVNDYFDKLQEDIQQAYPCYFEKFRTDGVEYDIYIGQSIVPDKPFSDIYLKNLRLMQLSSMATVAKLTEAAAANLPVHVQTTQLIFIHSLPIDIKFRNDEKRFDVEGSYNIRYQVVKKRIDKVLIKGTLERLTRPGKIALVYLNQQDANEYIRYIEFLQGQHILNDDLEELELEELQGVNGLKALRVGVAKENAKIADAGSIIKQSISSN